MRGRDKERERRERDLEKKAREQADQCEYSNINSGNLTAETKITTDDAFCCFAVVALEEQKANLSRDLSALKHTHNKVRCFFLA